MSSSRELCLSNDPTSSVADITGKITLSSILSKVKSQHIYQRTEADLLLYLSSLSAISWKSSSGISLDIQSSKKLFTCPKLYKASRPLFCSGAVRLVPCGTIFLWWFGKFTRAGEGDRVRPVMKGLLSPWMCSFGVMGKGCSLTAVFLSAENMAAQREWTPMVSSR